MEGLASPAKPARSFGELLRQHRLEAGIAQETLAERARLSVETISALERGARQKPYLDTIALLAEALALSPEDRADLERAASRRSAQPQSPANNLPAEISSFVGREGDVAKVNDILTTHRLLTLVGAGGVGKTRLALRVAAGLTSTKPDGVWFADFAAASDAARITATIASAIGLSRSSELQPLIGSLRSKNLLLVLDNCEHLIDSVAETADSILRGCPSVSILATSREALSTEGERVYRVPSLALDDAVSLFAQRAEGADSRFQLTDSVRQTVEDICRRLDGIALAIEIAAARIAVVSPETIAAELGERVYASSRSRTRSPRQQTLESLFDWSYELLNDRERTMFRKLSIFAGGFTQELASAVCSASDLSEKAVTDVLALLVSKSLVQCETPAAGSRYRLLEPMRQYARDKLLEAGEHDAAARAHATALLTFAERFEPAWETVPESKWLPVAERELDNFRAALRWALEADGDPLSGQTLMCALRVVWAYFAPAEGLAWAHEAQRLVDDGTPPDIVARLDLTEATLGANLAQQTNSLAAAKSALQRFMELGDKIGTAEARRLAGQALIYLGDVPQGEEMLADALVTMRETGSPRLIGLVLGALAAARRMAGDVAGARTLLAEALMNYRLAGADRAAIWVTVNLAEAEFQAGSAAEALRLIEEATSASRAFNDRRNVAIAQCNASAYLAALQRYDDARASGRAALTAALDGDVHYDVCGAWALQHLAAIAALRPSAPGDLHGRLRAARLLGYADARLRALESDREFTERREYETALISLRDVLGEDEVRRLMQEGAAWTEGRAVAEALEI